MNLSTAHSSLEEIETPYRSIFDSANDGVIIMDLETGISLEVNPAGYQMHGFKRDEFIQQRLISCVHPDSQHSFSEHIRTFQVDGRFDILTLQVRRDGSTFYAEWRGTALEYQDRPCLLLIMRDVSKRIRIEQLLHQREEIRAHEQAKLLEISHTLASSLEFQPDLILEQLREIIEYHLGCVFGLEDSTLTSLAMRGISKFEEVSPVTIHLRNQEILASLFNGQRPIQIDDVWNSSSLQAQNLRSLLKNKAGVLIEGMHSWMWVPLAVKKRTIGVLALAHEKRNYFTAHHADLALSAANQAAITMINAELFKHAQTLAVLEERQRLARNLHDAVNQSLFSAGLIAEVLPRLWDRDQEDARRSIEDLLRLTRGAQAEMRALLAELRPSTLIDSNLGDLLRLLSNALSARANIPVALSVTGNFTLPSEVQIAFYRVCQEALFNVAKHSKASRVEIDLNQDGADIKMRINDNGLGFDTAQIVSGHYGLGMMREHADAVGAGLSLTSCPDQGTELILTWTKNLPPEAR